MSAGTLLLQTAQAAAPQDPVLSLHKAPVTSSGPGLAHTKIHHFNPNYFTYSLYLLSYRLFRNYIAGRFDYIILEL